MFILNILNDFFNVMIVLNLRLLIKERFWIFSMFDLMLLINNFKLFLVWVVIVYFGLGVWMLLELYVEIVKIKFLLFFIILIDFFII